MKKRIPSIFLISFCLLGLFAGQAIAQVEDVNCFDYYKFQNGLVFDDFHPDKYEYSAGNEALFTYNLRNLMGSPVVEGKIRVQIFYNDSTEGEQLIDEFFAYKDVNLATGEDLKQDVRWAIPSTAKEGSYVIKTYYIVGDEFNLAGLSFNAYGPPGLPGGMTYFLVKNPSTASRIYFSKASTYYNDAIYPFGSFVQARISEPMNFKTKLVNEGAEKKVHVSISAYQWDDVSEKPIEELTTEKDIVLKANDAVDLTYSLKAPDAGVYSIRFVASSGNEKSVMKLRIPIAGAKGRLEYMGFDRFPLTRNEKTTLYFCLSNSADYFTRFNGTGKIEVTDNKGKRLLEENYSLVVSPKPAGKRIVFQPPEDATQALIKITLYDDKGNMMDSAVLNYDYSKFGKIDARLTLSTDKKEYVPTDKVQYAVEYKDASRRALRGSILLYLVDQRDNIYKIFPAKEIAGAVSGSLDAPAAAGGYKIMVRELSHDLKAESSIEVKDIKTSTTTSAATASTEFVVDVPVPEKSEAAPQNGIYLYAALFIAAAALIAFMLSRRKRK